MHIEHIAIWTNDIERLKDFYVKYFNCKASEKYENPLKRYCSYFLTFDSGARLEIMKREDIKASKAEEMIGLAHFSVVVGPDEIVDKLTKELENDGIIIDSRPRTTGDGYYESVILDPDNNKVEIISSGAVPWHIAPGGFGAIKVTVASDDYEKAKIIVNEFEKKLNE